MSAEVHDRGQTASAAWRPDDSWLAGIVLAVITFWLFAQTLLNIIPGIAQDVQLTPTVANLAVSITSLFSGCFVVVAGGLADRLGRALIMRIGLVLSMIGSAFVVLPVTGDVAAATMLFGRVVQGLSAACIMPSTMALVKTFYEGRQRQRALSFWAMGSWGGSGLCSLFGGAIAASFLGWRAIFYISIVLCLLSLYLTRRTPVSKAEAGGERHGFDWTGVVLFVASMVAINVYISQGPRIGWLSLSGIALLVIFAVTAVAFLRLEMKNQAPFMDLGLFSNRTFSGATLSNFLLNSAAGTLIVALGLVQMAAGLSSLQSGMLTIGYLIAVLSTIRVGEKLLQRFGPKKPMMWGCMITGLGILLTSATFLLIEQYIVLAVIGFTLFGLGLGFYATPSMDAALSNVPDAKSGSASGIYKMASSLGAAFGVAISAAIYAAGQNIDPSLNPLAGIALGNQDNVALRFGGALGLLFNVFMVTVALISVIVTVPSERPEEEKQAEPEVPPTPMIGS